LEKFALKLEAEAIPRNEPQSVLKGGHYRTLTLAGRADYPYASPIARGAFVGCKGLDQQTNGVEWKGETEIKQMPFVTLMNFNPAAI
jgi:hypothetical protein